MVILISGISCTGKTLMAQNLLEKYKIPYFSIDHLKMGLFRGDINCSFTTTDNNEVIGKKLWPIIKGIIMTNIENNQNIIIEGCYLLPNFVKDFEIDRNNYYSSISNITFYHRHFKSNNLTNNILIGCTNYNVRSETTL